MSFRHFVLAVFSAVIALSAQGGEPPLEIRCPQLHAKADQAVVVEVRGAQDLVGKPIALRKEKTNVCESRFERQGELAVAKLSFDPLPWGIRPDVLDVVVDGNNQAQLTAPLVLIGMRGNPPQDEVLAALKAPAVCFP